MEIIHEKQQPLLHPHLLVQRGNVRILNLVVVNAIILKRCALPECFGNWHAIYTRLRRWGETGVFDRLFHAMRASDAWVLTAPTPERKASANWTAGGRRRST